MLKALNGFYIKTNNFYKKIINLLMINYNDEAVSFSNDFLKEYNLSKVCFQKSEDDFHEKFDSKKLLVLGYTLNTLYSILNDSFFQEKISMQTCQKKQFELNNLIVKIFNDYSAIPPDIQMTYPNYSCSEITYYIINSFIEMIVSTKNNEKFNNSIFYLQEFIKIVY